MSKVKDLNFKKATRKDISKIFYFIKEIANYEKMLNEVNNNEEMIRHWIFDKKMARVVFICLGKEKIGFMLYHYNYSTFTGKAGIHLEDFFIEEKYRHNGYGKKAIQELINIAKKEGLGRIEWVCLRWNEPSIQFYKSIKATPLDEWITFRLGEKEIYS